MSALPLGARGLVLARGPGGEGQREALGPEATARVELVAPGRGKSGGVW